MTAGALPSALLLRLRNVGASPPAHSSFGLFLLELHGRHRRILEKVSVTPVRPNLSPPRFHEPSLLAVTILRNGGDWGLGVRRGAGP